MAINKWTRRTYQFIRYGFCAALVLPAFVVHAQDDLEQRVKGLSSLRTAVAEAKRPIRVLAVYSERAVGLTDSVSSIAPLRGLTSAALSRAADSAMNLLSARGVRNAKTIRNLPIVTFTVDDDQLTQLAESGQFAAIVEDRLARPYLLSSGDVMNVPEAHGLGARGAGRTVAILDTGVDLDHPFINGRVLEGACFSSNFAPHGATSLCPGGADSAITLDSGNHCEGVDGCDHGTHVAGIAAGRQTGEVNFNGVAPDANIMAVQVFSRFDDVPGGPTTCADVGTTSPCVLSYTSDQLRGLQRVLERADTLDIVAVNMSLGGGSFTGDCDADDPATKSVIDLLEEAGVATAIAAGNDGFTGAVGSPGCISTAVTVGSTTDADAVSGFSNMSEIVDLLAVGSSVESSVPGGGTAVFNGTSMATPQVAGAIAALSSLPDEPKLANVVQSLRDSGVSVSDERSGGTVTRARIDLEAAAVALGSGPALTEDCRAHDTARLALLSEGWWFWRRWTIVDGSSRLFYFGGNRREAEAALAVIQHFGFDETCYVGRPDPSMQYLKTDGAVPSGTLTGSDCIGFDTGAVRVEPDGRQWLMTDGASRLLVFPNESEARQGLAVVQAYGLNRQCFIGRPDPSFTYWLAQ